MATVVDDVAVQNGTITNVPSAVINAYPDAQDVHDVYVFPPDVTTEAAHVEQWASAYGLVAVPVPLANEHETQAVPESAYPDEHVAHVTALAPEARVHVAQFVTVEQATHMFDVVFKTWALSQTQQYVVELPQRQPVDEIDVHDDYEPDKRKPEAQALQAAPNAVLTDVERPARRVDDTVTHPYEYTEMARLEMINKATNDFIMLD